jgi:tetratricopeptide (TPR) repeat protein
MDAVFSTAADLSMISGEYEAALDLYSLNYQQSPREQIGYTVVDLVGAMIMCDMKDKATSVASECHNLARATHERNFGLSRLALGIASAHSDAAGAKDQLKTSIKYFSATNDSVSIGRAAINLAQLHWRLGEKDKAIQVLLDVREHITDLGKSGWRLLGLPTNEVDVLYEKFQSGQSQLILTLLGEQKAIYGGREFELSLRNAEVLAVLASSSSGVSGEQLAIELYGDGGNIKTLKSTVSKLRQLVPISSRPYALDAQYEADHVVIQRLISEGRTREALQLYGGPLLPDSEAPGIERLRDLINESIRQAVLASGDRTLLLQYFQKCPDDLIVLEMLHEQLALDDPQYPAVSAALAQIREDWEVS